MEYKSITFTRVVIPKPYESRRLEVTVELSPDDDPMAAGKEIIKRVEYLLFNTPEPEPFNDDELPY